jgi:hypothetical protein
MTPKIPKTWKHGVADEPWKVEICEVAFRRTDEMLGFMIYVLTHAGSDTPRGLADIRTMSGDTIVTALLAYRESNRT